jgi:branched-chain amino acid transport system substrate-binding protein
MRSLLTVLFIGAFALFGTAWAADPIVIGAYLPMTGNVASYGQMGRDGITMAQKIEPEVLGRPVDVKLADTKSDKGESANAVSRLIENEKVVAILGEMISSDTIAGSARSEPRRIPMVSPTATNPIVTQGKKYVFRVCFIDSEQGPAAAKLATTELKAKTAAIILDVAQDYSVALAKFFKEAFIKDGGKIVCEQMFKSGDREFTAQLGTIKATKPDIIYAPIYYTECALIAKQAKQMGLTCPIVSGDGVAVPEFLELGGRAVEDVYITTHFHRDMITTELGKRFLELWDKEQKKELDAYIAMSADAYFILLDAIKRAQSTDPDKIREALVATKDFHGISGTITMKPDGDPVKAMVICKVKGGKFTYVTTINP